MPAAAATYALPARVAGALGAPPLRLPRPVARVRRAPGGASCSTGRTRACGSSRATSAPGASLAAVLDGRSVDTTMGFTPLDGPGDGDPLRHRRPRAGAVAGSTRSMPPAELAAALEHRSGLLGLAGTGDMREVLAGAPPATTRAPTGARRLPAPAARRASPRWPQRSAGSTRWCSPAGWASTRRTSARATVAGLGFLGVSAGRRAQRPAPPAIREIGEPGAAVRTSSSPRAKTSRSRVRCGRYWGRDRSFRIQPFGPARARPGDRVHCAPGPHHPVHRGQRGRARSSADRRSGGRLRGPRRHPQAGLPAGLAPGHGDHPGRLGVGHRRGHGRAGRSGRPAAGGGRGPASAAAARRSSPRPAARTRTGTPTTR